MSSCLNSLVGSVPPLPELVRESAPPFHGAATLFVLISGNDVSGSGAAAGIASLALINRPRELRMGGEAAAAVDRPTDRPTDRGLLNSPSVAPSLPPSGRPVVDKGRESIKYFEATNPCNRARVSVMSLLLENDCHQPPLGMVVHKSFYPSLWML